MCIYTLPLPLRFRPIPTTATRPHTSPVTTHKYTIHHPHTASILSFYFIFKVLLLYLFTLPFPPFLGSFLIHFLFFCAYSHRLLSQLPPQAHFPHISISQIKH